jgi:hypothetical protein
MLPFSLSMGTPQEKLGQTILDIVSHNPGMKPSQAADIIFVSGKLTNGAVSANGKH